MKVRKPIVCLLISALWMAIPVAAETYVLKAAHLIDGSSDSIRSPAMVVVEGERIVSVGSEAAPSAGAEVIDLGSATLMPGLIDVHVHLVAISDDYQTEHLRNSSAYKALQALNNAQTCLEAGWTSLRIPGDADVFYATNEVKRAIDEGMFLGPRITGAAHWISITGGGGDINFISPEQEVIADGLIVDGVEEMRKAVREEIKYGSDWIKLLVTGAFMSAGDDPQDVHLSPEELEIAMVEANRLGVPVMAHAHSTEGIIQAVQAGVRSIEHGTFVDEAGVELMVENGTYLAPTLYIGDYYIEEMADSVAQKKMVELSIRYRDENFANIRRAVEAGVKIALGSDFSCDKPYLNAREFGSLIEAGMTPMQAIQAGTRVGAELLGWEDRLGTVEVGKLADLIAVNGNPVEDIAVLETVDFVMLGGKVVKRSAP